MDTGVLSHPHLIGVKKYGVISRKTATFTDQCQDYYATIYSAEIVNTLTNLLFVWLAFKGIANCINNGHDQIFLVTFVGYLIVGTGSFLFHSTLKCTNLQDSTGIQSR